MGTKMKVVRKLGRFQNVGLMLAGCFLASMAFLALSRPYSNIPFPKINLRPLSVLHAVPTSLKAESKVNSQMLGDGSSSSADFLDSSDSEDAKASQQLGSRTLTQEKSSICNDLNSDRCRVNSHELKLVNSSSLTTLDSSLQESKTETKELVGTERIRQRKPLCDISDPRADVCEMDGDIRLHGSSSTITFIALSTDSERNESYRIRPYARKGDDTAFSHVKEVSIIKSISSSQSPHCTTNHTVPAIVFSSGGYTGNPFHDFTDVLVPLFLTAREFGGEVQLLASDMKLWWIHKYQVIFQHLSKHPVIDLDKDDQVRCFPKAIIGLRSHKELSIDPSRAPNNYSMVDFTRFMRSSYSLERDAIGPTRKPRLLIISRKRTRAFLNMDEIVELAREVGYEPVVAETTVGANLTQFAQIVNSCDVMMGVHGAGLTNLVFLPTNATLIQVVPWGGLRWIAMLDFGDPAKDMKLRYLQYEIKEEESSLIEMYPRDHPVFKNLFSFHNRGWDVLRDTFMDKQNVRLDVKRFRAVLLEALPPVLEGQT